VVLVGSASACAATEYLTVVQSQKLCFPLATRFVPVSVTLSKEQRIQIEKKSGVAVRSSDQKVWEAYAKDSFLGWFIVDDVIGKHDWITWSLALTEDGHVKQIEILTYRENYGSEVRNPKWRAQFSGKTSASPMVAEKDIKTISGATLSSRHVIEGVRRLLAFYDVVLSKS
jgi:Na+-translocating ferredoxin:NAD+ oxidoreductase RnfG subunit